MIVSSVYVFYDKLPYFILFIEIKHWFYLVFFFFFFIIIWLANQLPGL